METHIDADVLNEVNTAIREAQHRRHQWIQARQSLDVAASNLKRAEEERDAVLKSHGWRMDENGIYAPVILTTAPKEGA